MSVHRIEAPGHAPLAPLCRPDARDTVLDRLCEVAHSVPDAIAIHSDDAVVTFDELLHRTYAAARKITHLAPHDPRPIAVEASCTVDSMTMMLAVMASGHSLVPLDIALPDNRRTQIVEAASALMLTLDDLAEAEDSAVPLPTITGSRTALIAFTSGSTGAAKGVLLSHRMCLTKAYEVSSTLGITPRDRVGNALPVSFGAGINTLFAGLLSGASVYCTDPRAAHAAGLAEWMEQWSLTTLHCSPSLVRTIQPSPRGNTRGNTVPFLRVVTTYGEALHSRDVTAFRAALGTGASFVNWYATTEAGGVAYGEYRSDSQLPSGFLGAGTVPRGKTIDIVDDSGHPLRPGEIGEIRVSAECLSDGYLGLADLTDQHFASNGSLKYYATGDLGRFDEGGRLELIGRADDAIKVRGYLVEPAEVESALRSIDGVKDAVVLGNRSGETHELRAYVTWRDPQVHPSIDEVRAQLKLALPLWMLPRHLVGLDTIPRNDRGKVDRASLPTPPSRIVSKPAATPTEWIVANIAKKVMGVESIGRDDEFTALGGTSLTATTMLDELHRSLSPDLSVEDMFTCSTVRTLAGAIDRRLASADSQARRDRTTEVVVALRSGGTKPPVFLVGGAGVGPLAFRALVDEIDHDRPVYALQPHARNKRGLPDRSIEKTAERYLDAVRTVVPTGPVVLVGHSLGGWIVLEMAHLMRASSQPDPTLIILDTRLFRHLLDKLPGGTTLPAAPAAATREEAGLVLTRAGLVALWLRIQFAGLLRYPTTTQWLVFASIGYIALERYVPKPWDGPLAVLRSESNTRDARSWAALTPGSVQFLDVVGEHENLLGGALAAQVGAYIGRIADTADSTPTR